MKEEQIAYVRNQLQAGHDESAVKQALASSGYTSEQIDALFTAVRQNVQSPVAPTQEKKSLSVGKIILIILGVIVSTIVVAGIVLYFYVTAALGGAMEKGQDASMKATLSNMRAQAEIYYDINQSSYVGLCDSLVVQSAMQRFLQYKPLTTLACKDVEDGYRMSALLSSKDYYCVDSTGEASIVFQEPVGTSCW